MDSDIDRIRVTDGKLRLTLDPNNYYEYVDNIKSLGDVSFDWDKREWVIPYKKGKTLKLLDRRTDLDIPTWVESNRDVGNPEFIISEDTFHMYLDTDNISRKLLDYIMSTGYYLYEYYDPSVEQYAESKENVIEVDYSEGVAEIPIGLKDTIFRNLRDIDIEYNVEDRREEPEWRQIDCEWNFPHELRDYQKKAVGEATSDNCIIQLPTGSGKTIIGLKIIEQMGLSTLILVHRVELYKQWLERVQRILGVQPGRIREDTNDVRNVTVGMIDSLANTDYMIDSYDCVITDECHHIPADTWSNIIERTRAYYRFGLSATTSKGMREDGKGVKIMGGIGDSKIQLTAEDLIERGYLAEPDINFVYVPENEYVDMRDWQADYRKNVVYNTIRSVILSQELDDLLKKDRNVLIDVDHISHGKILTYMIDSCYGVRSTDDDAFEIYDRVYEGDEDRFDPRSIDAEKPYKEVDFGLKKEVVDVVHDISEFDNPEDNLGIWLNGSHDDEIRENIISGFERGSCDYLLSTLLEEGVDIPKIDAIIMASGGKSEIVLVQTVGRGLRNEGSDDCIIIDFEDNSQTTGRHTSTRKSVYDDYYGKYYNKP